MGYEYTAVNENIIQTSSILILTFSHSFRLPFQGFENSVLIHGLDYLWHIVNYVKARKSVSLICLGF